MMEVEVVRTEAAPEGSKGIFDSISRVQQVGRVRVEEISRSFRDFCREFGSQLSEFGDDLQGLNIERVELNVELTVKGEIRMIAAASAETKGSIKLIFSRRP